VVRKTKEKKQFILTGNEYLTMKKPINKLLLLLYTCSLFYSCAAPPQTMGDEAPYSAKIFAKEYDEVWEAVEEIVTDDLRIPIKTKDKERGIIMSEWVSVIRMRGTLRWYIRIVLERGDDTIRVKVYDRVEAPNTQKQENEKMKTKKDTINVGWQTSQEKIPEVNEILNLLSSRFGE
jgi:hypothetical protein